jgi:hypothetical protein
VNGFVNGLDFIQDKVVEGLNNNNIPHDEKCKTRDNGIQQRAFGLDDIIQEKETSK